VDKFTVAKQGEVITNSGLALTDDRAELTDAAFAIGKREKNVKTRWVTNQFEEGGSALDFLRLASYLPSCGR
jgi:hypothetical protein